DVALASIGREVHEAEIKIPVARAAQRKLREEPSAPIRIRARRERVEQTVETLARLGRVLEPVETLHEIPQRVRVEHETGPRHDVRPIARRVLLQQAETLMLLREQPAERPLDAGAQAAAEPRMRAEPVETVDRDEPPQRRVDAADVPEILPARD